MNEVNTIDIDQIAERILGTEIARELLNNINVNLPTEEIEVLLDECKGNPWDVAILYQMKKFA